MDTKIFQKDLSVNATSAYILFCAVRGEGLEPRLSAISRRWNGTPAELEEALIELLNLNVISLKPGSGEADPVYLDNPAFKWGPHEPWPQPKGLPVFPQK